MLERYLSHISALRGRLVLVWRARKIWRKPKKAKILIYDRCGSDVLFGFINEDNAEILDVRGESVNIYVLLKCALAMDLSSVSYANAYIAIVNPSVVVTFIDNAPCFYGLKHSSRDVLTIFLQNGWRGETSDVFGYLKDNPIHKPYQVDYMLTFGVAIGEKYREYVKGQVIPVGSVRNNQCQIDELKQARTLVFISQYSPPPGGASQACFVSVNGRMITWERFYSAERKVIKFLADYCGEKDFVLQICGRSLDSPGEECRFFDELIADREWEFLPRVDGCGSYRVIDCAEFVVGIDSTLIYESLARGKRTGVFAVRSDLLSDTGAKFGWPKKLPDSGPFWTNRDDEGEFERVLDYVACASDAGWEKTRKEYVSDLVEYDPGNTRIRALFRKLDVQ